MKANYMLLGGILTRLQFLTRKLTMFPTDNNAIDISSIIFVVSGHKFQKFENEKRKQAHGV